MLLKKVVSIFFLLLYAFTSSGATVDMHYCGDNLQNISVKIIDDGAINNCCCQDGLVVKHKGCCTEKSFRPQVSKDLQLVVNDFKSFLQIPFQIVVNPCFQRDDLLSENDHGFNLYNNTSPNLWRKIPLYKLHRRFTYYG